MNGRLPAFAAILLLVVACGAGPDDEFPEPSGTGAGGAMAVSGGAGGTFAGDPGGLPGNGGTLAGGGAPARGAPSGGAPGGGAPGGGGAPSDGGAPAGGSPAGGSPAGGAPAGGGAPSGGSSGQDVIPDGTVTVNGRQIRVGNTPIQMHGVCWNPVVKGGTQPAGLDFAGAAVGDLPMMKAAGVNVVRTYESITDTSVLDALHAAGIKVAMSVYVWGGAEPSSAVPIVNAVKNHPAVLMWLVGNEWNYNGLYTGLSFDESRNRMQEAATLIKQADPNHPVATIYGELPSTATLNALSAIDVWGINTYRGISFGDLFTAWAALSTKPMFIAEYGADAYDARAPAGPNLPAQAEATTALAGEIEANAARSGGVCSGGTIFEWNDEWWKDGAGDPNVHDVGGIAPGGGPHPDATFNEEWWGIVTIDRVPRPAYDALKAVYTGGQ